MSVLFGTLVKNQLNINMWVYFWISILSHFPFLCVLIPVLPYFDYGSFFFLTSVNVNSPTLLFFFFKVVLSICVLDFYMNFGNNLSFFCEKES